MTKMGILSRWKERKYKSRDVEEKHFTAYVIKGNRQVVSRQVRASKRFLVDRDTYIIRPECIFMKVFDGNLKSVAFYREGNPNPYNFKTANRGLSSTELDRVFSEDFFNIVVMLQRDNKMTYMLIVVVLTLVMAMVTMVKVLMGVLT